MLSESRPPEANGELNGLGYLQHPAVELLDWIFATPFLTGIEIRQSGSDAMAGHMDGEGFQKPAVHGFDYERQRLPGQCDASELRRPAIRTGFHHYQKFVSYRRLQLHIDRQQYGGSGDGRNRPEHRHPIPESGRRHPEKLIAACLAPRRLVVRRLPNRSGPMLHLPRGNQAGENRHDEQARVQGHLFRAPFIDVPRSGPGGRSGILPTIRPGQPQSGARRSCQSGVRRGSARRPLVLGFCGSLRVVPGCFLRCRGCRTRRADAVSERLYRSIATAPRRTLYSEPTKKAALRPPLFDVVTGPSPASLPA